MNSILKNSFNFPTTLLGALDKVLIQTGLFIFLSTNRSKSVFCYNKLAWSSVISKIHNLFMSQPSNALFLFEQLNNIYIKKSSKVSKYGWTNFDSL